MSNNPYETEYDRACAELTKEEVHCLYPDLSLKEIERDQAEMKEERSELNQQRIARFLKTIRHLIYK